MALTLELVRDDALLRALHAIDVTSVVQLRAAMSAALHADDDARAGSADGDERYHYRGGPCALNRALVAAGHAPALAEELERMWRESGGAPLESPDAFTSTLVLMASVLADAMRFSRGHLPEDATTITDDRARLAETLRRLEGPSDVRRSALFGHLARATGLDDASCALAGELASVEITGAFQSDADPNPHRRPRERLLFTAPHGIFVPRQGERAHVPEEWTTLLATSFARATGGVSVTWSQPERARFKTPSPTGPATSGSQPRRTSPRVRARLGNSARTTRQGRVVGEFIHPRVFTRGHSRSSRPIDKRDRDRTGRLRHRRRRWRLRIGARSTTSSGYGTSSSRVSRRVDARGWRQGWG